VGADVTGGNAVGAEVTGGMLRVPT